VPRSDSHIRAALALGATLALSCGAFSCGEPAAPRTEPTASLAPSASGAPQADRAGELLRAELTRDEAAVTSADLSSRDVTVRRAAARALARMRRASARDRLLGSLHDEDEEVVAWAAYGLGDICAAGRGPIVNALAAAAAARAGPGPERGLSAQRAIVRAVGRCGDEASEALLASWALLGDEHAVAAIHALGDIARAHKRLREETYVVLLELAEGDAAAAGVPDAFYPLGRAEHLRSPSVIERTCDLAKKALSQPGPARVYAIRALGRCDEAAVPLLAGVLADASYSPGERAEAARNLARFGRDGQDALADALPKLIPDENTAVGSPAFALALTALDQLTIVKSARPALTRLAELKPPAGAPEALLRRFSWLRCTAAKLLAERDYRAPSLRACDLSLAEADRAKDPLPGSIGARAIVSAIGVDAAKISGDRLAAWRAYAVGGDIRAREAALNLLGVHDEIGESAAVLAAALKTTEPGLVGTAAEVIGKHPPRAQADGGVHPEVALALVARLDGQGPAADLEVLGTLIDAAGALKLEAAKAALIGHCKSPYAKIREHSEKALAAIMGASSPKCAEAPPLPLPIELDRRLDAPVTIELDTDVGTLELMLDPALAPIAVTRAADLARNGFYQGIVVHRVELGFVTQFGSPSADGYGGVSGLPSLPCETTPIAFGPLSVGVALAGRDTGSSQLFVTHVATPHLDGEYAELGSASGPWDALVDGDVIRAARVKAPDPSER
jgi:cyclophilin family peptidyl-prolyl cis-trans isomerase